MKIALKSKSLKIAVGVGVAVGLAYGAYLAVAYRELEANFERRDEFIPTRIYSDVFRIRTNLRRNSVLEKLRSLDYAPQENGAQVHFTLRSLPYPTELIPADHPTLECADKKVDLEFSGTRASDVLDAIRCDGREVSDLYLEPELVATLAKAKDNTIAADQRERIRENLTLAEIPEYIWKGIIAIEDQHFFEHSGLSMRGMARAMFVNLKSFSFAQGGSTLTQQLVKNLMERRGKNLLKKISELFLAIAVEWTHTKEEILERYLNEVYLGQIGNFEIHGVSEGAKYFFGKSAKQINIAEMAMIAGIINGPAHFSPFRHFDRALKRQRLVLEKMKETGVIDEPQYQAALKEPVRLSSTTSSANKAPYFVDFAKAELIQALSGTIPVDQMADAGLRVYTSLDLAMNRVAQTEVENGIAQLEKNLKIPQGIRLEGALAASDPKTGLLRVLIGGRNFQASSFNRILNMKRQVGSTFKPVVYFTALKLGKDAEGLPYTPAYPIEDAPFTWAYDSGRQKWEPKNYNPEFQGVISMRQALNNSINTATARLAAKVTLEELKKTSEMLGIDPASFPPGPAVSLGTAELTPISLLKIYSIFANRCTDLPTGVLRVVTDDTGNRKWHREVEAKNLFPPYLCDMMTDMLQTTMTEGTGRASQAMGLKRTAAGKSGTTSESRDAWFAGYTPEMALVTWVGLDQGAIESIGAGAATSAAGSSSSLSKAATAKAIAKIKLSGAQAALPIFVQFLNRSLDGLPNPPFQVSELLTSARFDAKSGALATSDCPSEQVTTESAPSELLPTYPSKCEKDYPLSIKGVATVSTP